MTEVELPKKKRWDVILVLLGCVVAAILSLVVNYLSPKEEKGTVAATVNSPSVINHLSTHTSSFQQLHAPSKKQGRLINEASGQLPNEASENVNKYVDIYLNVNSGDVVLVNGKPASGDEISETPNTLKLIAGHRYTIKINNCPEKEITAAKDMTISVCM